MPTAPGSGGSATRRTTTSTVLVTPLKVPADRMMTVVLSSIGDEQTGQAEERHHDEDQRDATLSAQRRSSSRQLRRHALGPSTVTTSTVRRWLSSPEPVTGR